MSTWKDRLQRASIAGMEFLTDGHEARAGRRLVVHEFPGADDPVVEDLGAQARQWKVNAYFVGPDYDLARNRFLSLLATVGAGWLIHPWLGRVWVRPREWSVSESNDRGGYAQVSVDFVPGGRTPETPTVDRVDSTVARVGKARTAVVAAYAPPKLTASLMGTWVARVQARLEGLRQVIALSALPLAAVQQAVGLVQGVKGDLATLLAVPGQYAAAFQSLVDVLGGARGLSDADRPRVVARLADAATGRRTVGADALSAATRAEEDLRRALMALAAATLALADYPIGAYRDSALASVVRALDGLLPTVGDAVFEALWAVRTGLIDTLSAQDLADARAVSVLQALPSTLLAHRLDADETVFIARNGVTHPLFVQGVVYG